MIRTLALLVVLATALHGRPGPLALRPDPRPIAPSGPVARDPDLSLLWRLLNDLSTNPDATPETRVWAAQQRDTLDAIYGMTVLDPEWPQ